MSTPVYTRLRRQMSEWIDLTQTLSEDSPTLPPLHPDVEYEDFATLAEDDYNSTILHVETHCGTHMDAPTHFLSKDSYRTIEEVTVDEMITEAVICDFTDKAPNEGVSRADLAKQAEQYDLSAGEYLIWDCGMAPADTDRYLRNFVYPEKRGRRVHGRTGDRLLCHRRVVGRQARRDARGTPRPLHTVARGYPDHRGRRQSRRRGAGSV
ncbi:MAG: putative metal-dependent hydrolase [halophilic archaeon J07HX5]|nr:MAG: putative metal-dependent hydrolase [halophilic archaeon J07HX5]